MLTSTQNDPVLHQAANLEVTSIGQGNDIEKYTWGTLRFSKSNRRRVIHVKSISFFLRRFVESTANRRRRVHFDSNVPGYHLVSLLFTLYLYSPSRCFYARESLNIPLCWFRDQVDHVYPMLIISKLNSKEDFEI